MANDMRLHDMCRPMALLFFQDPEVQRDLSREFQISLTEKLRIRDQAVACGCGSPLPMEDLAHREAVNLLCHLGEPAPKMSRYGTVVGRAIPAQRAVEHAAKKRRVTFADYIIRVTEFPDSGPSSSASSSSLSQDNGYGMAWMHS